MPKQLTRKIKKPIKFTCYEYHWTDRHGTMFLFYPGDVWDEDKLTIEEALSHYPIDQYEWIHFDG